MPISVACPQGWGWRVTHPEAHRRAGRAVVRAALALATFAAPAVRGAWVLAAPAAAAPSVPAAARRLLAAGLLLAAPAAAALLAGYAGYLFRVRPLQRVRGHIEIRGPDGEPLGRLRIPPRHELVVGAAAAVGAHLRLPWLPGGDGLFRMRVELDTAGGAWRSGIAAWGRHPAATAWVEAVWPYHLYSPHSGPLPRRRVDLDGTTPFSAAGFTFTYLAAGVAAGAPPVADLLSPLASGGDASPTSEAYPAPGWAGRAPSPALPGTVGGQLPTGGHVLAPTVIRVSPAFGASARRAVREGPPALLAGSRWLAVALWRLGCAGILPLVRASARAARWVVHRLPVIAAAAARGTASLAGGALLAVARIPAAARRAAQKSAQRSKQRAADRAAQLSARTARAWPDAPEPRPAALGRPAAQAGAPDPYAPAAEAPAVPLLTAGPQPVHGPAPAAAAHPAAHPLPSHRPPTRTRVRHTPRLAGALRAAALWVAADLTGALRFDAEPAEQAPPRRRSSPHTPAAAPVPWSPSASPAARASGNDLLGFLQARERR